MSWIRIRKKFYTGSWIRIQGVNKASDPGLYLPVSQISGPSTLSSLSPATREAVDPIAELLSQLRDGTDLFPSFLKAFLKIYISERL
jgi:hypothetical protein